MPDACAVITYWSFNENLGGYINSNKHIYCSPINVNEKQITRTISVMLNMYQ
jgi:hypothetical protein